MRMPSTTRPMRTSPPMARCSSGVTDYGLGMSVPETGRQADRSAAPICPARAGLHEYAVPTTASTRGGGARNSTPAGPIAPTMRANLAAAECLDRLGRYEPATTIAGFAFDPAHLRDVLGDQTYESLTREGKSM